MSSRNYDIKVISNTTPIIVLTSIAKLDLLPELFKEISIAESVCGEIICGGTVKVPHPGNIEWINIKKDVKDIKERLLFQLDEGEKQTILIALESNDDAVRQLLLMDERKGRKTAASLGLRVKGTLGVLADAKKVGLIDCFKKYAMQLLENNLYYDLRLINAISDQVD